MDLGNMTKEQYDVVVDAIKNDKGSFVAPNGDTYIIDRKIANDALAICNSDIAWCNKMLRTIPPYEEEGPIVALLVEYEVAMIKDKKHRRILVRDLLRNIIKDAGGPA